MNCGKAIKPDTKFCPHCGTLQNAEASSSALPPSTPVAPIRIEPAFGTPPAMPFPATGSPPVAPLNKSVVWAGVGALVLALVGGVGYWGWSNKLAGEDVVRKLASDEEARKVAVADSARKLSEEEQRRLAAEKAVQAAEIAAAQAVLDKHIAAEEAQAQAGTAAAKPKPKR
jgi:hypothetical protein